MALLLLYVPSALAEPAERSLYRCVKDGQIGYCSEDGAVVIPARYDWGEAFSEGFAVVRKDARFTFVDKGGRELFPPGYYRAESFRNGVAVVAKSERGRAKWGAIDSSGRIIIDPEYDSLAVSSGGFVLAGLAGKFGLFSAAGRLLIPVKYDFIRTPGETRLFTSARLGDSMGFVDMTGKELTPFRYKHAWPLSDDFGYISIPPEEGSKCGLINREGEEIAAPEYDRVWAVMPGVAMLDRGGKRSLVGRDGKRLTEYKIAGLAPGYSDLAVVRIRGKYAFLNIERGELLQERYSRIVHLEAGIWGIKSGRKWGLADSSGKVIVRPVYDRISEFINGTAMVKSGGRWGYVDKSGKELLAPKYKLATPFGYGLAVVGRCGLLGSMELNGLVYWLITTYPSPCKWGVVDISGKEIVPIKYDHIDPGSGRFFPIRLGWKYGLMDREGRETVPPRYDEIFTLTDSVAMAVIEGKYGLVSTTDGREITGMAYDSILDSTGPAVAVGVGGKYKFITFEGEDVSPELYDSVDKMNMGLYRVSSAGKYGVVDRSGRPITSLKYDFMQSSSGDMIYTGGSYMDRWGNEILKRF